MKKVDIWIPEYWNSSPMFSDHLQMIGNKQWDTWPDCNELNLLWRDENRTLSDHVSQFVPQSSLAADASYYEEHIYACGEIPTRDQNWHDFFNAQAWVQFPRIKSVINALHVKEIEHQNNNNNDNKNRSRKRDALTLFDESGVIFVSSEEQIVEFLWEHDWKTLFWQKKNDWWRSISIFIFGHGLYEKILSPYIGMTANALPVYAKGHFFDQDRQSQIDELDQRLSKEIQKKHLLETPTCLTSLPMLGVPGWWQENTNEQFYDNVNYFRPKR